MSSLTYLVSKFESVFQSDELLNNPFLAIFPCPEQSTQQNFCDRLLVSLGKSVGCAGRENLQKHRARLTRTWAEAAQLQAVWLNQADGISREEIAILQSLLPTECRLVLFFTNEPSAKYLKAIGKPSLLHGQLVAPLNPEPASLRTCTPPAHREVVFPDASFATFRQECEELLPLRVARVAQNLYDTGFHTASLTLKRFQLCDNRQDRPSAEHRAAVLDETTSKEILKDFNDLVARTVREFESPSHSAAVVRGMQASLFRSKLLLTIDHTRCGQRQATFSELDTFASMANTLLNPEYTSMAVLDCLTSDSSHTAKKLTLGNLDPDNRSIKIDLNTYVIPQTLFALINAQRLTRLQEGASNEDPLFDRSLATIRSRRRRFYELTGLGQTNLSLNAEPSRDLSMTLEAF